MSANHDRPPTNERSLASVRSMLDRFRSLVREPSGESTIYRSGVDETAERLARRRWPATPIRSGTSISFEYFPTTTPEAVGNLDDCALRLDALNPGYVSVTYGAGGSSRERTFATIDRLQQSVRSPVAGHLTTVNATRRQTLAVIDRYLEMGVRHLVALRGDPVAETTVPPSAGFQTAVDLVTAVRTQAGKHTDDQVTISVAAYPEVHPKATSPESDLANLQAKLEAGADQAITQFFYDNGRFLEFRDRCRQAGITAPIVAGIMPVTSFTRVAGFASRCGAAIPAWMADLYRGLDEAPDVHQLVSATVAAEQCRELCEHGVRRFHFYTMNRPELTLAICRILGFGQVAVGREERQAS
ncbi:MAG: methylenetetrahydrofolate reductase [Acidimicrobiia bacterium]|nr:methylenetetrahydrofolate reductase [Acidimicrobiia bacterium]